MVDPVVKQIEELLSDTFEPISIETVEIINKASRQAFGLSQVVGADLVKQYLPGFQNGLIHKYLGELSIKYPDVVKYKINTNRRGSHSFPILTIGENFNITPSRLKGINDSLPRPAGFRKELSGNNPLYIQGELFGTTDLDHSTHKSDKTTKFLYAILKYSFAGNIVPAQIKLVVPDYSYKFPIAVFDLLETAKRIRSSDGRIDLSVNEIEPIPPTLRETFMEFIEDEQKASEENDNS
jgi:hypothetical protein